MENPYNPNPETFQRQRKGVQEERMTTLVPEPSKPSPSVDTSGLQGVVFGALAHQPTGIAPAPSQLAIGGLLVVQLLILAISLLVYAILFLASIFAFGSSIPHLACIINLAMFPVSAYAFLSFFKKEVHSRSAIQLFYLFHSIYFLILACIAASGISDRPFINEDKAYAYIVFSLIGAASFLYFLNSKRVRFTYSGQGLSAESPSA